MTIPISYMGTKREIAPAVARVICSAKPGIVFDAFSGMCSVGEAIGERRQVWNNDIQSFASLVASALFSSNSVLPPLTSIATLLHPGFDANFQELSRHIERELVTEQQAFASKRLDRLESYQRRLRKRLPLVGAETELELSTAPSVFPYRLFTNIYAGSYFGLRQCLEIDSLVYSIHFNVQAGRLLPDHQAWLIIALGQSMIRAATTTGHFAQYLVPKEKTLRRYLAQRSRGIWDEFIRHVFDACPIGSSRWRARNRVFNCDSIELLESMRRLRVRPSVIYADPPYKDDQYSRYYHILETLVKYDYPAVSGKGLYRAGRFQTPFSQRQKVVDAFDLLSAHSADLSADLVVSYPNNGLLHELGATVEDILRRYYRRVQVKLRIPHQHSTFGASKGEARQGVTEVIYRATT